MGGKVCLGEFGHSLPCPASFGNRFGRSGPRQTNHFTIGLFSGSLCTDRNGTCGVSEYLVGVYPFEANTSTTNLRYPCIFSFQESHKNVSVSLSRGCRGRHSLSGSMDKVYLLVYPSYHEWKLVGSVVLSEWLSIRAREPWAAYQETYSRFGHACFA